MSRFAKRFLAFLLRAAIAARIFTVDINECLDERRWGLLGNHGDESRATLSGVAAQMRSHL